MFVCVCVVYVACVCCFLLASTCFVFADRVLHLFLVGLMCFCWFVLLFVACLLFVSGCLKLFLFVSMCLFVVACCWFRLVGSGVVCFCLCVC